MKGFWKNIVLLAALTVLSAGCTTDYPEMDRNGVPQASDLDVSIVADQETNQVTFTLRNRGMVPMWIFGEELVDGKPSKKFAYTQNGVTLRFRDAGIHAVEVKAYNANGISVGSKIMEFELENTYRDPFNPEPYFKALSNGSEQSWIWNSTVDGHFGCDSPVNLFGPDAAWWWTASANEKEGWGLYDDVLKFNVDGTYTYDPGTGGTVYVNKDSGYGNEYNPGDGNDYEVPIEGFSAKYWFEQSWSDAGIEQIDLCFDKGANVSYIPFQEALDEPRYRLMNSSSAALKKEMRMYIANSAIAWIYDFVPVGKILSDEEKLAGEGDAGKVWIMDAAAEAHIACGPNHDDPTSWWAASAYEKAESGMYDDELTFYPDGRYVFNPGPDGKIYANWGCTLIGPNDGVQVDNSLDWKLQESTYTFENNLITLPEGIVIGYVPGDEIYTAPVFTVTELTETHMTLVADLPSISWQYKFVARDSKTATTFDGQEFANGMVETSLTQGASIAVTGIDLEKIWVDPDFFTAVDASTLKFNAMTGEYRVIYDEKWLKVVPLKNGEKATYENAKALWVIGDGGGKPTVEQLIGWAEGEAPLPMARISENTYRITLAMKCEGGSIKIFGQSGWGMEWTKDMYGKIEMDGLFDIPESNGNIQTGTATPAYYTFTVVDNGGVLDIKAEKAKLGSTTVYDPESAANMWLSMTLREMFYYYSPDFAQEFDHPVMEQNGNDYTLTFPEATNVQWQAQVAFKTTMSSSAAKTYDFYLEMTSTKDHPGVTIKLTKEGDDGSFYFTDRHPLTADETFVYKMPNLPGIDMEQINLFLDFGGNEAGTVVNIRNIIFQEHQEAE